MGQLFKASARGTSWLEASTTAGDRCLDVFFVIHFADGAVVIVVEDERRLEM